MAKARVQIPSEVAARVMVASAHTCCKCEERGRVVQIHHIDDNPTNNDFDNLAVLCLICHEETQRSGGFSRKLSAPAVRIYRDKWTARVRQRQEAADALFVKRAIIGIERNPPYEAPRGLAHMQANQSEIERYIDDLPNVLAEGYSNARKGWDSGTTMDMKRATFEVIEVVRKMWLRLAREFPERHFGGKAPEEFMEDYVSQRYAWHHAMAEPHGYGSGGTIAGLRAAGGVLRDLETMVVDTVDGLRGLAHSQRARKIWLGYWEAARERT